MIRNLARAEFIRLVSRRFTQVMVALLLGAFLVTLATVLTTTHRPTPAEVATAERAADDARLVAQVEIERCEQAKQPYAPPELRLQYQYVDCRDMDPDRVVTADFLPGVFIFEASIRDLVYFLSAFLALFGFLVGASFVGAELTSGGMTNLLLWRPRRIQVLATKLGVLLAGVAGLALAATLLYLGTFWLLAEVSGHPGDQTGQFWGDLMLVCLRGVGLALIVSALGFALATAGRHTSTAVGLAAGYLVVWELGARIVMEVVNVGRPDWWMLTNYLSAWMSGHLDLGMGGHSIAIEWWQSGLVFAVLLTVFVGGAFTQFRRRDLA